MVSQTLFQYRNKVRKNINYTSKFPWCVIPVVRVWYCNFEGLSSNSTQESCKLIISVILTDNNFPFPNKRSTRVNDYIYLSVLCTYGHIYVYFPNLSFILLNNHILENSFSDFIQVHASMSMLMVHKLFFIFHICFFH